LDEGFGILSAAKDGHTPACAQTCAIRISKTWMDLQRLLPVPTQTQLENVERNPCRQPPAFSKPCWASAPPRGGASLPPGPTIINLKQLSRDKHLARHPTRSVRYGGFYVWTTRRAVSALGLSPRHKTPLLFQARKFSLRTGTYLLCPDQHPPGHRAGCRSLGKHPAFSCFRIRDCNLNGRPPTRASQTGAARFAGCWLQLG
jgi:hypothetical protein